MLLWGKCKRGPGTGSENWGWRKKVIPCATLAAMLMVSPATSGAMDNAAQDGDIMDSGAIVEQPYKYSDVHGKLEPGQDITDSGLKVWRYQNTISFIPDAEGVPDFEPGHDELDYPGIPTVTLDSGITQLAGDPDPADPQREKFSTMTVGKNGSGKINLRGGVLLLGGDGDRLSQGVVDGNINLGSHGTTENPGDQVVIDSALITRPGDWTITGFLTINKGGYLEIGKPRILENGEKLLSSLTIDTRLLVQNDIVIDDALLRSPNSTIIAGDNIVTARNGAVVQFNNLDMFYKNDHTSGILNFASPKAVAGDMSTTAIGALKLVDNNIDGRINVGRNSMVTFGSTDPSWLRAKIGEYQARNGLVWGEDITAALGLRAPHVLDGTGGLNVDGAWTENGEIAAFNIARFADKSLLVVDAASIKGDASAQESRARSAREARAANMPALSGNGTGTLKVESGARLLVTNAAIGDEIRIAGDFASMEIEEGGWADAATSTLLEEAVGEFDPATGAYVLRVAAGETPAQAFPTLGGELAAIVGAAVEKGLNPDSSAAGMRFISRAVDNRFIGANDEALAGATIDSAARVTVAGAVPQMTLAANNAAAAAITQRTSFAQPGGGMQAIDQSGAPVNGNQSQAKSFALWIMPLYQSSNGFGMEAGNFNYDFNGALGGVTLGGDYTFADSLRLGVSFNIGGGFARGSGDLNTTTNNLSFWGLGAYAGWTYENFGLSADVGFTSTYNKLKQELPAEMLMDDLKGDVTAWALGTGLRAEYRLRTDVVDIVPHAAFRFTNLHVDSYDVKSDGVVVNGDSYSQNIWTFPIGISLSREFQLENGWRVKPLLDLNVIPAAGDFNAKTTINFNGVGQEAKLETQMMDYITYGGMAGIEFGNDTISFGLNYNGRFGAESSAHAVFGTLRVEF